MLARQAAAAVGVGTCGRGKLLLRCRLLDGARRFGTHGEEMAWYIVAAARLYSLLDIIVRADR